MNTRQDSLHDQMMDAIREAERLGCYDAADWIKARWNMPPVTADDVRARCTCNPMAFSRDSTCPVHVGINA